MRSSKLASEVKHRYHVLITLLNRLDIVPRSIFPQASHAITDILTLNPYEPVDQTSTSKPMMRFPGMTAAVLIFGISLVAGAGVAVACNGGVSGEDVPALLVFFMSLAAVFGTAGAYLGCRHIRGRAPLWAIATAIGTFAILLPLASYPSASPVINWIAGLAAACALIATAIAGMVSTAINTDGPKKQV